MDKFPLDKSLEFDQPNFSQPNFNLNLNAKHIVDQLILYSLMQHIRTRYQDGKSLSGRGRALNNCVPKPSCLGNGCFCCANIFGKKGVLCNKRRYDWKIDWKITKEEPLTYDPLNEECSDLNARLVYIIATWTNDSDQHNTLDFRGALDFLQDIDTLASCVNEPYIEKWKIVQDALANLRLFNYSCRKCFDVKKILELCSCSYSHCTDICNAEIKDCPICKEDKCNKNTV